MPRRVALPPALVRAPFLTSTATAADVGEGRLRGGDLARPFHGVRSTTVAHNLLERCLEFVPLLRDGDFFSHETAARLWGCPLTNEFDPREPLHVSSRAPLTPVRRPGIVGHRASRAASALRFDLPVSDAAQTWLGLAATLARNDLVAIADHLILDPRELDPLDPRPYASMDQLCAALDGYRGRGARAAKAALALARQGAESRPETLLRLLLVSAGLPDPELQSELRTARRLLGYVDLYFRDYRVAVEYDGDGHRTSTRQYDRDITRIDDIVAAGHAVVRVRSRGLFVTPQDTIRRVTSALESRGWSPRARKPH